MKKTIFYLLTLFMILWIQMAVDYVAGPTGLSANIVLVVVLFFGLTRGPIGGEFMGLLWGLLMDASGQGLMGLHALLFTASGFFAGMLRRQLDERKAWTQTIFSTGVSCLYVVAYLIFDRLFSSSPHPATWSLLAHPFINGLIAPCMFWIMIRWASMWDMLPEER